MMASAVGASTKGIAEWLTERTDKDSKPSNSEGVPVTQSEQEHALNVSLNPKELSKQFEISPENAERLSLDMISQRQNFIALGTTATSLFTDASQSMMGKGILPNAFIGAVGGAAISRSFTLKGNDLTSPDYVAQNYSMPHLKAQNFCKAHTKDLDMLASMGSIGYAAVRAYITNSDDGDVPQKAAEKTPAPPTEPQI